MDTKAILTFIACVAIILIFGKRFIVPIRIILKLVINSCLGMLIIFIINLIGQSFSFHIGLNILNAIIVGILGIPGAALLIILKIFVWCKYRINGNKENRLLLINIRYIRA